MADNQVALTRMARGGQGSLSKATRQAVPPFLQKLYEMVSDSATDRLIRWSENGDSFFVLDHERVAHDVLPRWFKHNNFASFVRQLNMYGFHKIPHLQQGVLKSESETEIWNFEHPNFHRGQPDLLCLITRKKQAPERQGDDIQMSDREGVSAGLAAGLNAGSLVDINSIINGITAIKRHQATISADLNELKTSNQHLWQEALEARERHQKQQDTINRILKFLAGVFGHSANSHKGPPAHASPHAGIPRKRQRLMIEAASRKRKEPSLEPLDGEEPSVDVTSEGQLPDTRFVEMSPSPLPSKTPSVPLSDPEIQQSSSSLPTPQPPAAPDIIMGGNFSNQSPFMSYTPSNVNPSTFPTSYPHTIDTNLNPATALTSASQNSPKQEVLQAIANSPGALHRLLQLLNLQQAQQNIPMPPPLDLNGPTIPGHAQNNDTMEGYDNHIPTTQYQNPSGPPMTVADGLNYVEPDPQTMSLLHTDDISPMNFDSYLQNTNRLQKTGNDTTAIGEHIDEMESNLDSLIKNLGLTEEQIAIMRDESEYDGGLEEEIIPTQARTDLLTDHNSTMPPPDIPTMTVDPGLNAMNNQYQTQIPDFDFYNFINDFAARQNGASSNGGEFNTDGLDNLLDSVPDSNTSPRLSAFVDEVASVSDASSSPSLSRANIGEEPLTPLQSAISAASEQSKKTRKRKSDVDQVVVDRTQTKPKRKR